jgi:hypothetical protein
MSYPKNLSSRIQYLNNFSTNNVKINPSNSATGLTNISTGGDIVIDLPPNSMCDLSSLTLWADFNTNLGKTANSSYRGYFLSRYANCLISRIQVEIGGQTVQDISNYNQINQIFSDMQYSYESGGKKLLGNFDPLSKTDEAGKWVPLYRTLPDSVLAVDKQDKRKIAMNQFLGFLGGNGEQKYLDTSICGNVRITFTFDQASRVLIRSALTSPDGVVATNPPAGLTNADLAAPTYTLANVYATIKKVSIDDGVFFSSIATALSSGIPFTYMFHHFQQTKSSSTTGDLTLRMEATSSSCDLALFTYYAANGSTISDLPDLANLVIDSETDYPKTGVIGLASGGTKNCYCSNYFKRRGDEIATTKFFVNGELLPMYDLDNAMVYDKLLQDFNKHDSTDDGIFPGINSFKSFEENYWVASCRLSHVSGEAGWVSGYNANGVPITLEVQTTAKPGATVDKIGQLWLMTSQVMQCYSGRQINIIK